jgi:hypothetical protein
MWAQLNEVERVGRAVSVVLLEFRFLYVSEVSINQNGEE